MKLTCPNPKCKSKQFRVTTYVTETWLVDEVLLNVVKTTDQQLVNCPSVSRKDMFTCAGCGTEAKVVYETP